MTCNNPPWASHSTFEAISTGFMSGAMKKTCYTQATLASKNLLLISGPLKPQLKNQEFWKSNIPLSLLALFSVFCELYVVGLHILI